MANPFWKADPRIWPVVVGPWASGDHGEWPEELMREDLRWMIDQLRVGKLAKLPGRVELRRRWSCPDRTARRLLRELGDDGPMRRVPQVDHARTTSVPQVDHARTTGERSNQENELVLYHARTTSVPQADHARTTGVHTRVDDRAQSTEHRATDGTQGDVEQPSPGPQKPGGAPDAWTTMAETYGGLPGCRKPRDRRKGNGALLRKLLDHHGPALTELVLRWWAYDDTPDGRALYLRSHGHGLPTLARNERLDAYAELATAWDRAGRPGDPEAKPVERKGPTLAEQIERDHQEALKVRQRRRHA